MQILKRLARRWADGAVREMLVRSERQLAETQSALDAEQRKSRVLESERDEMADVIVRNRQRVQAEIALATRNQAEHEQHGRHHSGAE